jgi:hypothetical protein
MSDEVDRQVFDEAARELIRKKLTRYMEESRIGVPPSQSRSRTQIRNTKFRLRHYSVS